MKAKIAEKKEIAKGTLLVTFELPKEISFKPGQYFNARIFNPPYSDAKGSMRHFSIVNSPNEKGVLTMATRLRESAFKKSLAEFPIGTEVEVDSIRGDFTLPDKIDHPLVFIAGGIGITPFISMLWYVGQENPGRKITLLYSNRDQTSTAFLKELQNLASPEVVWRGWFKLVLTMTEDPGWKGEKGRIDADFIKKYVDDLKTAIFYVAGPPAMVEAITQALKETGVDSSQVKSENFTGY